MFVILWMNMLASGARWCNPPWRQIPTCPRFSVAELRHRFVSTLSNRQGRSIAANPDLREITWKLVYFMETGPCCQRFFICALKYVSRSLYFLFFFFCFFSRTWDLEEGKFVSRSLDRFYSVSERFSYFCRVLWIIRQRDKENLEKEKFKSFSLQGIWKRKGPF